ncbi:MAG: sugar phosphate isomerase/epimerase [Bacteroidales bacterium]|nr:sugar phosphate isomerase/epimerase [Bacteroidales bacterium]
MNRRIFLKKSAILGTGLIIAPSIACTAEKLIGLQIYSVRQAINQDLEGTLTRLAEMGYNSIEHAGYRDGLIYNLKPSQFKSLVDSLGMKLLSGHVGINPGSKNEEWEKIIADNAEAGLKYVVAPSIGGSHRDSLESLKRTTEAFNQIGSICKKYSMKFGYHNHAFEFQEIEGKRIYDILLDGTDPELVTMEMDLYWTYRGNCDPLAYFDNYPGRFELWHVKDMEDGDEQFFAEVGHGILDFGELFAASKRAGLVHYFVEQDASRRDPMDSVKMSVEYLKNANF